MVVRSDWRIGPSALESSAAQATAAIAATAESLQSHVEVVLGGGLGLLTDEQRDFLAVGWRNGRRLLKLIDALETIALAESGTLEVEWTSVDLGEVTTRAAEHVWPVAVGTRKRISLDRGERAHVIGAADAIARAVEAMLEHAVEQSRPGAEIQVAVGEGGIELRYPAEGLPASDELAVALAEATCRLHGGHVSAGSESGFATVSLTFAGPDSAAPVS
jgi:signal transduction histidine kinase